MIILNKIISNPTLEKVSILIFIALISYLITPDQMFFQGGDFFHTIWSLSRNIINFMEDKNFYETNILYPYKPDAPHHEIAPLNTILFYPFFAFKKFFLGLSFIYFFHSFASILVSSVIIKKISNLSNFVATLGGIAVVITTFRITHASHLQILATELFLLNVLLTHLWIKEQRKIYLLLLLCNFILVGCGPSYIFISSVFFFFIYGIFSLLDSNCKRLHLLKLYFTVFLAIAINTPIWFGYLKEAKKGFLRVVDNDSFSSVDLIQFFTPIRGGVLNFLEGRFITTYSDISNYFPGYILFFFILYSIFIILLRYKKLVNHEVKVLSSTLLLLASIFILISLGQEIKFDKVEIFKNPVFYLFYDVIPILKATRFLPFYGYLGIILLLIISFSYINLVFTFKKKVILYFSILIVTLAFLENRNFSALRWQLDNIASTFEPRVIEGYSLLDSKLDNKTRSIISLPIWGYMEYNYMFYSLFHRHNTYNGIDGFYPHKLSDIEPINSFPSTKSLETIKQNSVDAIVVHRKYYTDLCQGYSSILNLNLIYESDLLCIFTFKS